MPGKAIELTEDNLSFIRIIGQYMPGGFFIYEADETEKLIYPLLHKAKSEYSMYSNQIFLIKYHMISVIEAIKHQG